MRIRQNKLSGALKDAVEQGVEAVAAVVNNADLDARYAAGQEQAAKVLAQLPIVLPHLSELKQRATDGVHEAAHAIGDKKLLPARAKESGNRRGRYALLLALSLGIGAAIAQVVRRRQPSESTAEASTSAWPAAEKTEPEVAASPPEADDHAKGSVSRTGSVNGTGNPRRISSNS